jgi:hypothetical protein
MSIFQKASKKHSKLRLAVFGPSGSGKTYTALSIAEGLGSNICLIDSERGSAQKYADKFNFDVADLATLELEPTIDTYISLIKQANGLYDVLIIDSLSHAWQSLLDQVDLIAKTKFKGNTWGAWSEGTPKQREFINTILSYKGHVIATMRSKTEWTVGERNRPERVGLSPEQGKGIEYEFDMLLEMSNDHAGIVLKDRTGKFQDKTIKRPGKEFGLEISNWLGEGVEVSPTLFQAIYSKIKLIDADTGYGDIAETYFLDLMQVEKIEDLNPDKIPYYLQILNRCESQAKEKVKQ